MMIRETYDYQVGEACGMDAGYSHRVLRATAYVLVAVTLFLSATLMFAVAGAPSPQPAPADATLEEKLFIVELFFLLVGLAVVAAMCILLWLSWRRKRLKSKDTGKK